MTADLFERFAPERARRLDMRPPAFVLALIAALLLPAATAAQPPVVVVGEPTEPAMTLTALALSAEDSLDPKDFDDEDLDPDDLDVDEDFDDDEPAFTPAPVSLGLSGLVGTREGAGGGLAPTWTAGFDLGLRLGDLVAIGARRVTVGSTAQGREQWAVGLSPYVELAGRVTERVELYGQLGAALEVRAGLGAGVGVAPFTGGGVRFFVADIFSIAAECAVHVPLTDTFLLGHEVFPLGAVILQGGLALAFHLG